MDPAQILKKNIEDWFYHLTSQGVSPNEAAGRAIQLVKSGRFYTPEVEDQVELKTDFRDEKDSVSENNDFAQRQRYDSACTSDPSDGSDELSPEINRVIDDGPPPLENELEENQLYQEPYQDTEQSQINDSSPITEEFQEEEDDDPDLALAMKMSLESYQEEEESMKTEEKSEDEEKEFDTDNESRRIRYDTMATVIEVGDDGEYRNPTPPEDIDPDLFIGADDYVEDEDEDDVAGDGLVDSVAVELVSRLNIVKESQTTDDIYPADVSEFTDYLRRGKITGLRTLVRSVFSCPKTLAFSFKLDKTNIDIPSMENHDWDGLIRIFNAVDDHPLLSSALEHSMTIFCNHHIFSPVWHDVHIEYRIIALMKMFENQFIGAQNYQDISFPTLLNVTADLSENDKVRLTEAWSRRPATVLTQIVRNIQTLITHRVSLLEGDALINDDLIVENAVKVIRVIFFASLLGGEREKKLLDTEVVDTTPCSIASSTTSSVVTIPDEFSRTRRANSMAAVGNQIYEIIRGHRSADERLIKAIKDPMNVSLKIDWNTTKNPLIPNEEFFNKSLNDKLEVDKDYVNYKLNYEDDQKNFTLIQYPYMLSVQTKTMSMFYDNRVNQIREKRRVMNKIRQKLEEAETEDDIDFEAPSIYLTLKVRRDFIVEDSLSRLELYANEQPEELRKQLVVQFQGEDGLDEGGVSREYFRLIIEKIFSPDFGLFIYDDETDFHWFNPYPPVFGPEEEKEYMLIGMILGLAIYNNITLDVNFPPVLFKKILGYPGTFDDMEEAHPTIYRSMVTLLQYDGELPVEDCFCLTYQVSSKTVFGQVITHNLLHNGDDIEVTEENRADYVNRYTDWLLNKCIKKQFNAFLRGFELVTDESPLKILFRTLELEQLVCGQRNYDWTGLKKGCKYDGGFHENHHTVLYFWEVFDEMNESQRKTFLEFVSGSDRCPVGGLERLKMTLTKNGPDSNRLPSAHTCFNVLLLPEYSSKSFLKERMMKALENSMGFGMV